MNVTERGWIGHYCLGDRCLFRRNTLIEHNNEKIVVSSVGNQINIHAKDYPNVVTIEPLQQHNGKKMFFETKVFKADDSPYMDADISQELTYESEPVDCYTILDMDWDAFHDRVVEEMKLKIEGGKV